MSVQVVLAKKDPHLRLAVKLLAMTSEALALITNLKNKSQAVVLPAFGLTLWGSKGEASGTTPQTDGEEKGPDGAFFYLFRILFSPRLADCSRRFHSDHQPKRRSRSGPACRTKLVGAPRISSAATGMSEDLGVAVPAEYRTALHGPMCLFHLHWCLLKQPRAWLAEKRSIVSYALWRCAHHYCRSTSFRPQATDVPLVLPYGLRNTCRCAYGHRYLENRRAQSYEELRLIGRHLCEALAYLHGAGYVHRRREASKRHVSRAPRRSSLTLMSPLAGALVMHPCTL